MASIASAVPAVFAEVTPTTQHAPSATWSHQIDDALRAGMRQQKDTLIWFSGSGWNEASDAVEKPITDPAFASSVSPLYVLVRADFPAAKEGDAEVDPAYALWAERLGVTQLPAIVALDTTGRPYGTVALPAGDVAACIKLVQSLQQHKASRDAAFSAANRLAGADRAKELDRGLSHVGPFAAAWYSHVVREVVQLDAQNALGLKAKFTPRMSEVAIDKVVQNELYPML
ncbi:MAG TPA: hypothetical protein VGB55_00810, partial [Tepidisphaeraceae bacterium]